MKRVKVKINIFLFLIKYRPINKYGVEARLHAF
jgi:hypothetical protein